MEYIRDTVAADNLDATPSFQPMVLRRGKESLLLLSRQSCYGQNEYELRPIFSISSMNRLSAHFFAIIRYLGGTATGAKPKGSVEKLAGSATLALFAGSVAVSAGF